MAQLGVLFNLNAQMSILIKRKLLLKEQEAKKQRITDACEKLERDKEAGEKKSYLEFRTNTIAAEMTEILSSRNYDTTQDKKQVRVKHIHTDGKPTQSIPSNPK
jgi:hypothetical protein